MLENKRHNGFYWYFSPSFLTDVSYNLNKRDIKFWIEQRLTANVLTVYKLK